MSVRRNFQRLLEVLKNYLIERNRPKYEPTDGYFYLSRHLAKCMMGTDAHNSDNYPVIMEMTGKNRFQSHTFFLGTKSDRVQASLRNKSSV